MGKILYDEQFKHVDYQHTDLRKTFARVRAQMREQEKKEQQKQPKLVVAESHQRVA